MDWEKLISVYGPFIVLVFVLTYGAWKILVWVGIRFDKIIEEIAKPMVKKHTDFIDKMGEHLDCEEKIIIKLSSMMGALNIAVDTLNVTVNKLYDSWKESIKPVIKQVNEEKKSDKPTV